MNYRCSVLNRPSRAGKCADAAALGRPLPAVGRCAPVVVCLVDVGWQHQPSRPAWPAVPQLVFGPDPPTLEARGGDEDGGCTVRLVAIVSSGSNPTFRTHNGSSYRRRPVSTVPRHEQLTVGSRLDPVLGPRKSADPWAGTMSGFRMSDPHH
jgi:hypothetical protein